MKFWESKFKDSILNIKYEDMIKDNEGEIKKIINFCNLDWEDNCLKFYNNKTPIKTMSTAQARQPIYQTSIELAPYWQSHFMRFDHISTAHKKPT